MDFLEQHRLQNFRRENLLQFEGTEILYSQLLASKAKYHRLRGV